MAVTIVAASSIRSPAERLCHTDCPTILPLVVKCNPTTPQLAHQYLINASHPEMTFHRTPSPKSSLQYLQHATH